MISRFLHGVGELGNARMLLSWVGVKERHILNLPVASLYGPNGPIVLLNWNGHMLIEWLQGCKGGCIAASLHRCIADDNGIHLITKERLPLVPCQAPSTPYLLQDSPPLTPAFPALACNEQITRPQWHSLDSSVFPPWD